MSRIDSEPHLRLGDGKLAIGNANLQGDRAFDQQGCFDWVGFDALTVAADVMELGHLGQAGEKRAAVRFQDPGASLEFEQGEASEGA